MMQIEATLPEVHEDYDVASLYDVACHKGDLDVHEAKLMASLVHIFNQPSTRTKMGPLTSDQLEFIMYRPEKYPLPLTYILASILAFVSHQREGLVEELFQRYEAYLLREELVQTPHKRLTRELEEGAVEVAILYDPNPNAALRGLPKKYDWLRSHMPLVEATIFETCADPRDYGLEDLIPDFQQLEVAWVPLGHVVLVELSEALGEEVRHLKLEGQHPFVA